MSEPAADIVEDLRMVAPANPWTLVIVVAVIMVISGVAVLLVLYLRRRRKRQRLLRESAANIPPEQTARERLAAIRHLMDEGQHREFVIEVSRVLRFYIEERFSLRAPHLSTEEFLFEAEDSPLLTEAWKASLGEFLFHCDRVKFALANLEPPRLEALYRTAEHFIDETAAPARENASPQPSIP